MFCSTIDACRSNDRLALVANTGRGPWISSIHTFCDVAYTRVYVKEMEFLSLLVTMITMRLMVMANLGTCPLYLVRGNV